jgi:hypothetical protein
MFAGQFPVSARPVGVRTSPYEFTTAHLCPHTFDRLTLTEHKRPGQRAPPAGFEPATRRLEDVGTESARVHPCRRRPLDQDFHRAGDR